MSKEKSPSVLILGKLCPLARSRAGADGIVLFGCALYRFLSH